MVLPSLSRKGKLPSRSSNHCDVGIGARFEGSDRSFIAEDLGRSGGTADDDLVEWKAKVQQFRHGRRQIKNRPLCRAGEGQVGRDCIGQKALVERLLDHRKAEVVSAMRAIEDDAVALRFDDLLEDQLFLLAHDAVCAAMIAVGDDVARLHVGEQLRQWDRRVGDVHHHRHAASHIRCPARQFDRLRAVLPDQPRPVAELDADSEVGIFADRAGAALGVGVGEMG